MSIKELIKESNYETLKKMYELDNIEEYREWYINEYGKSVSIGMFLNDNMEDFREWVLNLNDIKIQYIKLQEKIVSKGLEYRSNTPVKSKYKIENREYTLEDDEELEMFHFRLYDDYGKLFGVILLYENEISENQQKKIDAAKEAGIKVGGEELINELEFHNITKC